MARDLHLLPEIVNENGTYAVVAQITLGNIYNNGGRTVVGGSQSGLDTEGIIKALTEARRLPADRLEDKNTALGVKTSAYNTLSSLLSRFQSAVDVLRNPPGVNNATQNIFQYRTAGLTSTGINAAGNYLGVSVVPGTPIQNFNVSEITQLAREAKQNTNSFFLGSTTEAVVAANGDATPGALSAGTFSLRNVTPGGDPIDITLAEGDSLSAVVNKFNAVKDSTGIQANILKVANGVGNNEYKIVFTATKTGETYGFDLSDPGTVLSDPDGVLSQLTYATQTARNAIFVIDGVEVEREANTVNDVIDGVTFTLKQAMTDGTQINAEIRPDTDIVANAITQFADVYNEFRLFAAKQQEVGENGLPTDEAVLANETLMRTIISQVSSEMTRVVSGITGGQPERFADIGLNFSNFAGDENNPATKNIMTVDTDKLASALATNFDGVRGLFEFTMTSDHPSLGVFARSNATSISNFVLNIDRTNEVYTATYVDSGGITQVVQLDGTPTAGTGGVALKGRVGTVLEGLELIFATSGDATIDVNLSQGYGDRLFNLMESIVNPSTGTLATAMKTIDDQVARNEKEIVDIDSRIEIYREQLLLQYSALEAALTQANQLLSLLDAQAQARQANS